MKIKVIKAGGNILSDPQALEQFLQSVSQLEEPKVIVHGGGNKASEWAQAAGLKVEMIKGRRVTDARMIEIVQMVYSGINKQLTACLQYRGHKAVGVCGADMGMIKSKKRRFGNIDFGYVGDISSINTEPILNWLREGIIPVFSALTYEEQTGHLLNTNADTIASSLSIALTQLGETELIYCFDKRGVLQNAEDPATLIEAFGIKDYEGLKDKGILRNGILPKIENSLSAIEAGVSKVRITHYQDLNQGTLITK